MILGPKWHKWEYVGKLPEYNQQYSSDTNYNSA